jgi:DNA-binding XRE family transcriptional regulator
MKTIADELSSLKREIKAQALRNDEMARVIVEMNETIRGLENAILFLKNIAALNPGGIDGSVELPLDPAFVITKEEIRFLRIYHGLSQKDLGARLGLSQGMISDWEKGSRPIPVKHVTNIRRVLGRREQAGEVRAA